MIKPFFIGLVLATILIFFLNSLMNSALADTNTVSSTVVTDKAPPTANAPSVVVNNSDICKTATSGAVQTQILGIASGITITDENCERIKLARSLYGMGMKVAAVSTLCTDHRVFDAMWFAGTYCPYDSKIGTEAKQGWEENPHMVPEGSIVFKNIEQIKEKVEETKNNEFYKFIFAALAMYSGITILF